MTLETIWKEYRASLMAFLHSKISDGADVDDVLQEILIKTHQHLAKLHAEDSIKPWLFQIANHAIIDFYRRNGRLNELKQHELEVNGAELDAIKQALSHCIAPFIQALSQDNAELLTAIDLNNTSQKAYAKSLGIRYSTLKSRVQSARKELRMLFDGCCAMTLDAQGNVMDYDIVTNHCKGC